MLYLLCICFKIWLCELVMWCRSYPRITFHVMSSFNTSNNKMSTSGSKYVRAVYTMDHEAIPRPSKRCDWTLKSSRDDLGLHQGKNGTVTTEVEVHKFIFLSLLYPLPWSNGFSVGTSKRGGLGKIARAHVRKMPF
jgi:hypothetical protein